MRHRKIFIFWGLALAVLIGCASRSASNSDKQPESKKTDLDNGKLSTTSGSVGQVSSGQIEAELKDSNNKTSVYFTGSGGKGMSLGILVPVSRGLNANHEYLPSMVQGGLVSNISKYSAITVLDRVSLDRVIAETLDPTYKDNLDIVSLGHVAQVGYMMTGNILRTSTGYALQLNVTETTPNASTIASYSGTCTVAQFDDFSAIHIASKELLSQMGVQLTDTAIAELNKASTAQEIKAQTNLAQGIIAQQKGTTVEAMAYYYNAVSFDPKLAEANGRLSALSSNITSGNIGANVRNDIQQRKAWLDILRECEDYFTKHPPYEIVYHTNLAQGKIDYQRETVDLSSTVEIIPTNAFQIVNDILKGLEATGKRREWSISLWPLSSYAFADRMNGRDLREVNERRDNVFFDRLGKLISISFRLINDEGKVIATTVFKAVSKIELQEYKNVEMKGGWFSVKDDPHVVPQWAQEKLIFSQINVNVITDHLTIQVVSVNDVDITKNSDYIRITAK